MKNNTKLWLENPMVFILDAGFLNFIPTREMNKTEQINACTLFLLYILIFTHLFKINHKYINIADPNIFEKYSILELPIKNFRDYILNRLYIYIFL